MPASKAGPVLHLTPSLAVESSYPTRCERSWSAVTVTSVVDPNAAMISSRSRGSHAAQVRSSPVSPPSTRSVSEAPVQAVGDRAAVMQKPPSSLALAQLEQDFGDAGFKVTSQIRITESRCQPEMVEVAIATVRMVLEIVAPEVIDRAIKAALKFIDRRRLGTPERCVILYGPKGEILKRATVKDRSDDR